MDGGVVGPELISFVTEIATELSSEDKNETLNVIGNAFAPILDYIHREVARSNLLVFHQYWFGLLQTFASIESLATYLILHSTPRSEQGRAYSDTLFGAILCLSCLPKTHGEAFDFFDKPSQQVSGKKLYAPFDAKRSFVPIILLLYLIHFLNTNFSFSSLLHPWKEIFGLHWMPLVNHCTKFFIRYLNVLPMSVTKH